MQKRLAIITTHPIQYNAPFFKKLSHSIGVSLRVFYTWGDSVMKQKYDPGFGRVVEWDIPLLEGYEYSFLENTSQDPGSHHFKGIVNPTLLKDISDWKPDAILVYGWSFKSHLQVMRHFAGKMPVWFRGDSTLLDDTGGIRAFLRVNWLRWVYRHIDLAFYTGIHNKAYFRKAGLRDHQLVWAPHVVDNERFSCNTHACREKADLMRNRFGFKPEDQVLLFAGKLESKKAPDLLLEAYTRIHKKPNQHLLITGNGVLEKELKEKYGQATGIHFMDFCNQQDMPALYAMADVFILPSRGPGETWGLAVNEAMAAGKPALVTDRCGCAPDLVIPHETGWICRGNDLDDLTSTLQACVDASELWKKMGAAAYKRIQQYSLDVLADTMSTQLNKLPVKKQLA